MKLKRGGYENYTVDGKVVVNKVFRFENLQADLDFISKQVGINEQITMPRAKSKYRKDKRSYREILSEEDKKYISELFKEEINLMGYRW